MQRVWRAVDVNDDIDFLSRKMSGSHSPPRRSPRRMSPGSNGGANCILHTVSKFDTLAGVAIKYGVEVADIKRLNGLATDLQMFALKTLQIPLPGRHPPSPSLCNGHSTPQRPRSADQIPPRHRQNHLFDSFQSLKSVSCSDSERKVSPAMSTLQGYYGLRQPDPKASQEAFEMGVYNDRGTQHLQDGSIYSSSPLPNPPLSHHRKSRSVANSLMSASGSLSDPLLSQEGENSAGTDKWAEKLLRRRQKSETDFSSYPPEKLLKEEISNGSAISTITGKGVALRPKSASRTASGMDGELLGTSPFPPSLGDSHLADSMNAVRKSSSTSSLQDTDNGAFSSIWPTSKWSLKPDFQALSSAAIPIFDGLPKSIGKKNKAALD